MPQRDKLEVEIIPCLRKALWDLIVSVPGHSLFFYFVEYLQPSLVLSWVSPAGQNLQNNIGIRRRLRSACASHQFESSLYAYRSFGSLATHRVPSEAKPIL